MTLMVAVVTFSSAAASPTRAASGLPQAQKALTWTETRKRLERSDRIEDHPRKSAVSFGLISAICVYQW